MLSGKDAVATVAVSDLARAKAFYEGKLGFAPAAGDDPEVLTYTSGATTLFVYRSQYAGTNQATAVTWLVGDDLEPIVVRLKRAGVTFEHYDMPGLKLDGDIHVGESMNAAWLKDPDGNILALIGG